MAPATRAPSASLTAIIGPLSTELKVEIFFVSYAPGFEESHRRDL